MKVSRKGKSTDASCFLVLNTFPPCKHKAHCLCKLKFLVILCEPRVTWGVQVLWLGGKDYLMIGIKGPRRILSFTLYNGLCVYVFLAVRFCMHLPFQLIKIIRWRSVRSSCIIKLDLCCVWIQVNWSEIHVKLQNGAEANTSYLLFLPFLARICCCRMRNQSRLKHMFDIWAVWSFIQCFWYVDCMNVWWSWLKGMDEFACSQIEKRSYVWELSNNE